MLSEPPLGGVTTRVCEARSTKAYSPSGKWALTEFAAAPASTAAVMVLPLEVTESVSPDAARVSGSSQVPAGAQAPARAAAVLAAKSGGATAFVGVAAVATGA